MISKYYIKIYDEDLISFDIDNSFGITIKNIEILNNNKNIYPVMLQKEINEVTIINFINSRIIPKNRTFVEQILNSLGLTLNDRKGIIDVSLGLSLTDSYWIVKDNNLRYDKYNLYDNDFSEALSLVAFTGYQSKIKELITSPELTTNGMLPKAWRRINKEILLYKGSSKSLGAINTGYEPYSEFFATQLLNKLNYYHVNYYLDKWKCMIVSVCPLFTSKECSYVQIGDLIDNIDIIKTANYFYEQGYFDDFSNMILFDALVMNTDRHFGNFGLIRHNKTGKFISMAPIFDNGNTLLSMELPTDLENREKVIEIITAKEKNISFYGISYDDLVLKFCNKKHIKDLNLLANFKFNIDEKYGFSKKRMDNLSFMIRYRAKHFIDLLEKQNNSFIDEQ